MCFRISLSKQCEQSSVICSLLACLQHDNAWPHTTCHTMIQIRNSKLEVLPDLPQSPHFIPSNFHIFWLLKDTLCWSHFRSDEGVKEAVHEWLAYQPEDFFCWGMYALVEQRWRCAELGGGLHWRLMSLCHIYFCNKSLYIILPVFNWICNTCSVFFLELFKSSPHDSLNFSHSCNVIIFNVLQHNIQCQICQTFSLSHPSSL